jgi:hypothetical protein
MSQHAVSTVKVYPMILTQDEREALWAQVTDAPKAYAALQKLMVALDERPPEPAATWSPDNMPAAEEPTAELAALYCSKCRALINPMGGNDPCAASVQTTSPPAAAEKGELQEAIEQILDLVENAALAGMSPREGIKKICRRALAAAQASQPADKKDAERLDWLELRGVDIGVRTHEHGSYLVRWHRGDAYGNTIREAIDNAILQLKILNDPEDDPCAGNTDAFDAALSAQQKETGQT